MVLNWEIIPENLLCQLETHCVRATSRPCPPQPDRG